MIRKYYIWLPTIVFDFIWILLSYFLKSNKMLNNEIIQAASYFFVLIMSFSIYQSIRNNIYSKHKILFDLAKLPYLVILSHALVLFSGTTFSEEGGWLFLYASIIAGVPLSILLWISGLILSKFNTSKQT